MRNIHSIMRKENEVNANHVVVTEPNTREVDEGISSVNWIPWRGLESKFAMRTV